MNIIPRFFFSLFYGIYVAFLIFFIYNHVPEAWLQEWDASPNVSGYRPAKRLSSILHLLLLFFSSSVVCYFLLSEITSFHDWQTAYVILLLFLHPVLILIFISDLQNRIIPHQFLALILICSIGKTAIIFFYEADISKRVFSVLPFFQKMGLDILCGVFIAALFFLPSILIYKIKQTEIIGFGDIKLIFVCTLLCGIPGIFFVLCISFLAAGLKIFLSMLVQKYMTGKTYPLQSKIESENKSIHFSNDPAYIPLAPFFTTSVFFYLVISRNTFLFHSNLLWNL